VEISLRWTWNADKNRANRRDHGIDFETAALVFDDPLALTKPDPHPDGDRLRTVGVIGPSRSLWFTLPRSSMRTRAKTWAASLAPARRRRVKGERMKKSANNRLTAKQRAELAALAAMPDNKINTADIPEQRDWSGARRGMFFRPVKQQITLRLDADLIDWFRRSAKPDAGYQTRINDALREYVAQHNHAGPDAKRKPARRA
jgi:uncharacterized protein (DUF4415 family)/uncharacterized DUF497 family protein